MRILIIFLFSLPTYSFAGNFEGNGGDLCGAQLHDELVEVLDILIGQGRELFNDELLNKLTQLKKTGFKSSCVVDPICVNGARKVAKNFPQEEQGYLCSSEGHKSQVLFQGPIILMDKNYFKNYKFEEKEKLRIYIHEILGLVRLEGNDQYQISGTIVNNLFQGEILEEKLSEISGSLFVSGGEFACSLDLKHHSENLLEIRSMGLCHEEVSGIFECVKLMAGISCQTQGEYRAQVNIEESGGALVFSIWSINQKLFFQKKQYPHY